MAIEKLVLPAKDNAVQLKINEIIEGMGTSTSANTDLSNLSTTGEAHFGKVKTVNNTSPDSNGNVSLSIPTTTSSVTSGSTAALTSGGAYTNLVSSVVAHSTDANKINVTKNGSTTTITVNNVAHATSADSATSATSATKIGSSDVGSATQPIFLDDGVATACTYTLAKSVPSDAVFTDTDTKVTQNVSSTNSTYPILLCPTANASTNQGATTSIFASGVKVNPSTKTITATTFDGNATTATTASKLGSSTVGGTTTPIYLNAGTPTALNYTIAKSVPADAKFTDTTYSDFVGSGSTAAAGLVPKPPTTAGTSKYLREDGSWQVPPDNNTTYANGSGITIGTGNAINHSNSVTAATAGTSSATSGSTLAVPYVTYDAQGHVTASGTHTHTVTGFSTTDTKNTAGSTDTSSKIFLVGATSQAANPQTYSHDTAFVDTSGQLNSANPSASTNSTVVATTKWVTDKGYTSNTGTVTSVNNVLPVNGNVTLSIPDISNCLQNKGSITSSTTLTSLTAGIYEVNGVSHSDFPTTDTFYGALVQLHGTYKPQYLVAGGAGVGGFYYRRYLTGSSSWTAWGYIPTSYKTVNNNSIIGSGDISVGTVKTVNSTSPDANGNVSLTIPTVNNATLTIQKNGTTVKTFTANASSNVTCNITVPTNTNELTNGAGFVTSDTKTTACSYNTTSKIFLIGATAQSTATTNAQAKTTYSNSSVYAQDGYLYATTPASTTNDTTVATTKFVKDQGYTSNTGTITGIKMNGVSKGTSGVVDLGTVITDISGKQDTLVSGTSIKTINNTSILGSGNIDTSEIFVATFGSTTYQEISSAIQNGKIVFAVQGNLYFQYAYSSETEHHFSSNLSLYSNDIGVVYASVGTLNAWYITEYATVAKTDLSNLSGVGQAVIDGKANTSLSNLSATGKLVLDGSFVKSNLTVVTGLPIPTADKEYTLTNLPTDASYLVWITCVCATSNTSGKFARTGIKSSICDNLWVCATRTRTNSMMDSGGSIIIPVSSNRKIWVSAETSSNSGGTTDIYVRGYRRIGTN